LYVCVYVEVESSAPSSLSCTIAHVAGLNVHYSEGNSCQGDVKPVTESAENSVQPWTPSKQLILSSSKMQPSTPTGIKTEVHMYYCTLKKMFCKSQLAKALP